MKRYKIAFLISHPIQYFSPLFREMAADPMIDLTVYYCSDEGAEEVYSKDFNAAVKWDIPLFNGYKYKILKNLSLKPSIFSGFFGLMNFGIIKEIKKERYDAIIIHGWNYFSHVMTILVARALGTAVYMRGDNPCDQEQQKPLYKIFLKRILLQQMLFRAINAFLYVGWENKAFYKFYGVSDNKLYFVPHAVDNQRFMKGYQSLSANKEKNRQEMLIGTGKRVILFVGKLTGVKRPLDLLKAYEKIADANMALVYVGDGPLRSKIEKYVAENDIKDVYITGFKNQTELPRYYAMADIFVLPSLSETWGLVINEAMCFHLPVIVSDTVGCSKDLVRHGENGFVFKTGDIDELSRYLSILVKDYKLRVETGQRSFEIIQEWDYKTDIRGILSAVSASTGGKK